MSIWEFACCMEGLREFHGGEAKGPEMSDAQAREFGIEGF